MRVPPATTIIEWVSEESGVSVSDLLGPSQSGKVVPARAAAYILLREIRSMSYPEIAAKMNRRSHNTVWGAVNGDRRESTTDLIERVNRRIESWRNDTSPVKAEYSHAAACWRHGRG